MRVGTWQTWGWFKSQPLGGNKIEKSPIWWGRHRGMVASTRLTWMFSCQVLGRLLAVGGGPTLSRPTKQQLGLRTHRVTGVRAPSHSEEDSGVGTWKSAFAEGNGLGIWPVTQMFLHIHKSKAKSSNAWCGSPLNERKGKLHSTVSLLERRKKTIILRSGDRKGGGGGMCARTISTLDPLCSTSSEPPDPLLVHFEGL